MTIILLCLLCIMLYKVKLAPVQSFHNDYLSHKNTVLVNGVFVILVYLSHSSAKVELSHSLDTFYLLFKQHLLQLVVVTFLFYSGYGMCESMKRKKGYVTQIFKQALEYCKNELKLERVMVSCNKYNEGSRKTIINAGGVLEREYISDNGENIQVYWIDLNN